ncbi:MAG TPA: ParB/RepB/Spo0J family partition protein [Candidatus Limnocylindrales bacterium]|nr:ParB/RepB/Spo0J family partition protein [Candidatus Limnocylindrales bacterium]
MAEERDLSPAILSLISPEGTERPLGVRQVPLDRIEANPEQPRMNFDEEALAELAASIREHGVLQPVLVRPAGKPQHYQLVAGERRWRASRVAGLTEIPALIEQLDDETAMEIGIIENLQREDLSPLEEAMIYDRMTHEHGYSVRRLAQKLGKDKGYIENRLRLAGAPTEIKQLVSLRKDTVSHAYELLKVEDPKKRRRLAEQVASGELSLVKLREKIEGRPPRQTEVAEADEATADVAEDYESDEPLIPAAPTSGKQADDALIAAKQELSEALERLGNVLGSAEVMEDIGETDRANLAKYLTIAKLRLENAITVVRTGRQFDH